MFCGWDLYYADRSPSARGVQEYVRYVGYTGIIPAVFSVGVPSLPKCRAPVSVYRYPGCSRWVPNFPKCRVSVDRYPRCLWWAYRTYRCFGHRCRYAGTRGVFGGRTELTEVSGTGVGISVLGVSLVGVPNLPILGYTTGIEFVPNRAGVFGRRTEPYRGIQ